MKLQFDPSQTYQIDAIIAIADLFQGQPLAKGDSELQVGHVEGQLQLEGDLLIGNNLLLDEKSIFQNTQNVQKEFNAKNGMKNLFPPSSSHYEPLPTLF